MSALEASDTRSARPLLSRPPIEGPSAWLGADMRGREAEWTYRLSRSEIAEIEMAVKAVQARGLDIADIRREDFSLPTVGPVLDRLRAEVLDGRGFVLLRGLPVEDRPIAASATAFWGIGTYFGSARSQNAQGHLLGHVYDLGKGLSATNPNLRSYATAERQNFHIDRCDVVALLCLQRAKSGGLSSIVSSMAVHNVMAARRPDLLDRLYQPFPIDRRGEVPEGKARFYEAPVFNKHEGYVSVLYSRLHIGSSQRFPEAAAAHCRRHRSARYASRIGRRPRATARYEFHAGRHPVPAQPYHPARPLGLRGLARNRAANGTCCGCGSLRRAPGRCRRCLQNATAASRLAIAAASSARERGCMHRSRRGERPAARKRPGAIEPILQCVWMLCSSTPSANKVVSGGACAGKELRHPKPQSLICSSWVKIPDSIDGHTTAAR